mgnify:CR=1 FL=1
MCEFISWVEKEGRVYFLTQDLIHNTPRGDEIQRRFPGSGEIIGHAAIRAYFELDESGVSKEQTDFGTPNNFPPVIVEAIKKDELRGDGFPQGLLLTNLYDDYKTKRKLIDDDYEVKCKLINDDYEVKRKLIDDDYWTKHKLIYDDYWVKGKLIDDDYWVKGKLIDDDYWGLFAISENRNPAWR